MYFSQKWYRSILYLRYISHCHFHLLQGMTFKLIRLYSYMIGLPKGRINRLIQVFFTKRTLFKAFWPAKTLAIFIYKVLNY